MTPFVRGLLVIWAVMLAGFMALAAAGALGPSVVRTARRRSSPFPPWVRALLGAFAGIGGGIVGVTALAIAGRIWSTGMSASAPVALATAFGAGAASTLLDRRL